MPNLKFEERVTKNYGENAPVILRAYSLAQKIFAGKKRINGDEYITHPVAVAGLLVDLGLDYETIVAALLHDSVKMNVLTYKEIKAEFGENIEALIKGFGKISSLQYDRDTNPEAELEKLRQMFLALGKDIRVILIRICDRYHNLTTLINLPREEQIRIAQETMDIFVPLVERLGMGKIKSSMEDICFRYLKPDEYARLDAELQLKFQKRAVVMNGLQNDLKNVLNKLNIKGEVTCRFKHIYSIYRKLARVGLDKIYDIIALRVMVNDIKDCYAVLGEIHARFKPIPGRIKDYIASPKPNGYQSLHTTLLTPEGVPFEVQIRTFDMHMFCEYGVAAHWRYKEGNSNKSLLDDKIAWFKKTIETEKDIKDPEKFLDALKMDLSTGEIWVLTPKFKPIALPEKATPVDFAYAIHTNIGNKCVGAKVNDRMVPLNTPLSTGDVVEIITSANSKGPSLDWLNFVRSAGARSRIRAYFKTQSKEANIKLGHDILELEAKKCGYQLNDLLAEIDMADLTKRFNLLTLDDVFASIGYGGITARQALGKVVAQRKLNEKLARKAELVATKEYKLRPENGGVYVDGLEGVSVRFGQCCHPIAGDDIVGFASRSRGITIHRKDCPNIRQIGEEKRINVEWKEGKGQLFNTTISILAQDNGLALSRVTTLLANLKVNIASMSSQATALGEVLITMTIQVQDRDQAKGVIIKLRSLEGIYEVK